MWHRFPAFIMAVCFLLLLSQQHVNRIPEFAAPVKGQMQLTGTFGELRGAHFHAGLDIRGAVGRPVYAIADGFISRIVIEPAGYGQALYLDHPSGHTSLYAHLDRIADPLAQFVKDEQYKNEAFALEVNLSSDKFPVKKGDLIGYIGKKGYAFGPHLHFEIRDTKTQNPVNPMGFGITVADTRRPFYNAIRVYDLDQRGNVKSAQSISTRHRGNGQYILSKDTVWVDGSSTGLAVKVYDKQNNLNNWNGIYGITLKEQDSILFEYRFDSFSFEQTRYINAHCDYEEQKNDASWFHRVFRLPGNHLSIYAPDANTGQILLKESESKSLSITTTDHAGNEAIVQLVLKRKSTSSAGLISKTYTYFLPCEEESYIDNGKLKAHFQEHSFYEDIYLPYHQTSEPSVQIGSAVHQLGDSNMPVHRYFDLQIKPDSSLSQNFQEKALISYCEDGGDPISYGGEWAKNGMLRAPVRAFGNFSIMIDDEAPSIKTEHFAENMQGWDQFSFIIKDNFQTSGKARKLRFRAAVDGQWVLMEYDYKNDRLFHVFDERISRGAHSFILKVTDDRGNEQVFEKTFVR